VRSGERAGPEGRSHSFANPSRSYHAIAVAASWLYSECVAFERSFDGTAPVRAQPMEYADLELRIARAGTLGVGTLACPDCDAPVFLGGRQRPHDPLSCGYCGRAGALREFLSLAAPSRPARVAVRVVLREQLDRVA
jgi:hypothetical protein